MIAPGFLYGNVTTSNSKEALIIYKLIKEIDQIPEPVSHITTGENHLLALTEKGNVYALGANDFG